MLRCGLLGEKLGHSYSPQVHALLGDYEYRLYERRPEELENFVRRSGLDGFNVTIPYKKAVVPFLDELSAAAAQLGSVNTVVRRADGSLFGDNTDYYGFESLVRRSGIEVSGAKALVLGSGGASVTVCAVLHALGAGSVTVISRSGEDNYENIARHADADIVVNTTPVGMYPRNGETPLDLRVFEDLKAVFDIVYNPARTELMLQAERLNFDCFGGLYMLVAQAARSSMLFTGSSFEESRIEAVFRRIDADLKNIILIGMPGSGKTSVARLLGSMTGRPVHDADALIEETAGMSIPAIFEEGGEDLFRLKETEALAALGKLSGAVIATGGGCVTREENYQLLHQNGVIFCLDRALDALPTDGRPLSQANDLAEMYRRRAPLYTCFADRIIDNNGALKDSAREIMEVMYEDPGY